MAISSDTQNSSSTGKSNTQSVISKKEIKRLMKRSNIPALMRLFVWVALLISTGSLIWLSQETLWLVPALILHGIVMVHHFSLQHECIHYSAFRERWINNIIAYYCGFLLLIPPLFFRYEHTSHHSHTNIKGEDAELIDLPSSFVEYFLYISSFTYWKLQWSSFIRKVAGNLTEEEKAFIPQSEQNKVIWESRLMAMFYLLIIFVVIRFQWYAPIWYWWLPVLLGEPFMRAIRMTEHVGCPQKADFKINTRTSLVSSPLRFLCWNMNYHAEHHFAPSVPFHALPLLHEKLKDHITIERGGYLAAHKDIIGQIRNKQAA